MWEEWKAEQRAKAVRALLKALPKAIAAGLVLFIFVKVFSVGGLVATIKFLYSARFIIAILAFVATIGIMVVIAGGAIQDHRERRAALKRKRLKKQKRMAAEAKVESPSASTEPEPQLVVAEAPPVLAGLDVLKWIFSLRDRPEAR